jgi:DNA-binding MarR family transcriptional regulator
MSASEIESIQRDYPRIYLACHSRHVRAKSTRFHLSARDSSLLAHLSERDPITPTRLAAHLQVGRPALSAAITRLAGLGYIARTAKEADRRSAGLTLTALGAKAMADTSVLDRERLEEVLARLTAGERRSAVRGLGLLARASSEAVLAEGRRSRKKE